MADHVWTVLCRRAVLDRFDNTVSMFDTIEEIKFETEKALPPAHEWSQFPIQVMLVTFLVRSDLAIPEQSRLKIEMFSPQNETYEAPTIIEVDLIEHLKSRHFTLLKSLPFKGRGQHRFVISLECSDGTWERVAEVPVMVEGKQKDPLQPEVFSGARNSTKKKPKRPRVLTS